MGIGKGASRRRQALEFEAAFSDLYRVHVSRLLSWFQYRTFSAQVSADLCAETFAVALEKFDTYDPSRGDPGAWLWGIAKNLLLRYHHSEAVSAAARNRLAIVTDLVADDELDMIDRELALPAIEQAVASAVGRLAPPIAEAVRLRVLEGRGYDDVARECECSVGAARVRVSRGLAELFDNVELATAWEVLQ